MQRLERNAYRWNRAAIVLLISLSARAEIANDHVGEQERELLPLTPSAAVETVRFMEDWSHPTARGGPSAVSISKDSTTYIVRLISGDAKRNGVWLDVRAGRANSLTDIGPKPIARLFSTGLGSAESVTGADNDSDSRLNELQWIDNKRVVFLWGDTQGVRQVTRLNLDTHQVDLLTRHPTQIHSFGITANGTVIFSAAENRDVAENTSHTEDARRRGFTVDSNTDALSAVRGQFDGTSTLDRLWNSEWYLKDPAGRVHRLDLGGRRVDPTSPVGRVPMLSPDERYAAIATVASTIPGDWDLYTNAQMRAAISEARRHPSSESARDVRELFIVDLETGSSRRLWPAMIGLDTHVVWSPDSKSILLGRSFVPPTKASFAGLAGDAFAVVDVRSGQYEEIPVSVDRVTTDIRDILWTRRDLVQIDTVPPGASSGTSIYFRQGGRGWTRVDRAPETSGSAGQRITFELRQNIAAPPKLFARDNWSRREMMLLDPNPDLTSKFRLAQVREITGVLSSGESWHGVLFYPVEYKQSSKYPLVIQSQYDSSIGKEFTLNGWGSGSGLGPTQIACYAAQMLANRDMFVLQLDVRTEFVTTTEAKTYARAFEEVIELLADRGQIDRSRVAIVGFSRNGYFVEYALTHSNFAFAAAITADNYDPSYIQSALTSWRGDANLVNGALPFGEGLTQWLLQAPGFNVEKIRTPLLMIGQSLGSGSNLMTKWEIYSRLRYLNRPVEFYMMPEIDEHPSHSPQNPAQVIAVQQRSIDWLDFWLNNREDSREPGRYTNWRRLRALQESVVLSGTN